MAERVNTKPTAGGRPRKFKEPSGPVTVTLPDRTLELLRRIDADRARAIVKAVDAVVGSQSSGTTEVEIVQMAPGTGLVIVPPNRSLRSIRWIKTIEVAPTRHLLAIVPGEPVEKIEIALLDLIEEARDTAPEDVPVLLALREKICQLRRSRKISAAEILCVSMDGESS